MPVFSNRWFILSILFLARISMGYQFQSIGSVSPSLMEEFAIEYAAVGTLIGLQSLPGLFSLCPAASWEIGLETSGSSFGD